MSAAPLAILAAAVFGGADFLGGIATREASVWRVTFLAHSVGAVLICLAWLFLGGDWTPGAVGWGIAGGFAGTIGLVLLLDALATGRFQLVSPLSAVTGAVVPVLFGLISDDRPTTLGIIGLLLTPPAVWLLASGSGDGDEPLDKLPLAKAVAAGVGFGIFFIALDQTPEGAGVVPLVAARLSSVPSLGVVAMLSTGALLPVSRKEAAVGSGALDILGNGLFLAATRTGSLAVIGALVALYPGSNAVLARIFLGEQLLPIQRVGFALSIAAAALLSI